MTADHVPQSGTPGLAFARLRDALTPALNARTRDRLLADTSSGYRIIQSAYQSKRRETTENLVLAPLSFACAAIASLDRLTWEPTAPRMVATLTWCLLTLIALAAMWARTRLPRVLVRRDGTTAAGLTTYAKLDQLIESSGMGSSRPTTNAIAYLARRLHDAARPRWVRAEFRGPDMAMAERLEEAALSIGAGVHRAATHTSGTTRIRLLEQLRTRLAMLLEYAHAGKWEQAANLRVDGERFDKPRRWTRLTTGMGRAATYVLPSVIGAVIGSLLGGN